jgi:hypothetical protein
MKREIKPINENVSSNKDWRDAFVEAKIIKEEQKVIYCYSYCVKIDVCNRCNKYGLLCAYVGQFENGGFWFGNEGLYFVTNGSKSDKEATYEDAKKFLLERM